MKPLQGKVAVVAGATRGAGRGIASMLGEAGATVYCTGRSTRGKVIPAGKPENPFDTAYRRETIEETAEMVTKFGGVGIPVQVDHLVEDQVKALFERVKGEQGRLDILVNDIWGGEELSEWGKPFWEADLQKGFTMMERAIHTHIITSRYGVPLLVEGKQGLVVEITDGDTNNSRGTFLYDLVKSTVIRMAYAMSEELRPHGIAAVAVTPGFLRSEAMLEHFGVTEENWRDGVKTDEHFIASETPFYVGRAIAALAADPNVMSKTGKALSSWGLSDEYPFTDMNGERPHWGRYFAENVTGTLIPNV
jgi:NAD(P)-dependent dehydrogenase (short-subunit alcohol dehydrogenase family)